MSRPDKQPPEDRGRRPEPGGFIWLVGLVDLMLPWVGAPLALAGLVMTVRGYADGWWMLLLGIAMLLADVLLTIYWSRPTIGATDQPLLNRRAAQYVGRLVVVVQPIRSGQGRVRVGDSIWTARGPDCDTGAWVRIVAVEATHLSVTKEDHSSHSVRNADA